jgi:hypothetical protein
MRNHTFWWVFSVVGAHNQQAFCILKWRKKSTKTTKGAHSSPISMVFGSCCGWAEESEKIIMKKHKDPEIADLQRDRKG